MASAATRPVAGRAHDPDRRAELGYLIAFALLLAAMLPVLIAAQSAFQLAAGVSFNTGETVGPIGGFAVVGLLAIWIIVSLLCGIPDG